jgi:hypothetical protein
MAEIKHIDELEINQDLPHQRHEWTIERVGWIAIVLLLLAGLAGLLGPGPLSQARASDQEATLGVEYNRFEHYQAPSILKIHLGPGTSSEGQVRLWINRDFIENIQLEHIDPEPESMEVGSDRITYVFKVSDPNQPTAVTYHYEPNSYGSRPIRIGIEGGSQLTFTQFFFP